jgi:hypothetical protein
MSVGEREGVRAEKSVREHAKSEQTVLFGFVPFSFHFRSIFVPFSFHFRSLLFHFRSFLFVFVRELAGLRGCGVRTAAHVEQVSFPWGM